MVEYFWEYDYKFGEFLKKIFPNTYKRKYSMSGNGIYNLILIQDKVYEVKFSQVNTKLNDNGLQSAGTKELRDSYCSEIIQNIIDNLKNEPTINNGKLTFNLGKFIAKVEVIKKMKMPE